MDNIKETPSNNPRSSNLLLLFLLVVLIGGVLWFFVLNNDETPTDPPPPPQNGGTTEAPDIVLTQQQKLNLLIRDSTGQYIQLQKTTNEPESTKCLVPMNNSDDDDENVGEGDAVVFDEKCGNTSYWKPLPIPGKLDYYSLKNMKGEKCLDYDDKDLEVRDCSADNTNQHFRFHAYGTDAKVQTDKNSCIVAYTKEDFFGGNDLTTNTARFDTESTAFKLLT